MDNELESKQEVKMSNKIQFNSDCLKAIMYAWQANDFSDGKPVIVTHGQGSYRDDKSMLITAEVTPRTITISYSEGNVVD